MDDLFNWNSLSSMAKDAGFEISWSFNAFEWLSIPQGVKENREFNKKSYNDSDQSHCDSFTLSSSSSSSSSSISSAQQRETRDFSLKTGRERSRSRSRDRNITSTNKSDAFQFNNNSTASSSSNNKLISILSPSFLKQKEQYLIKNNILSANVDMIISITVYILDYFKLLDDLPMKASQWYFLIKKITSRMQAAYNPYHNIFHILDVYVTLANFLKDEELFNKFKKLEIVSLFLSALFHDLDHPGLNNTYHITSENEIALTYNDLSVLENYHASQAFKMMKEDSSVNIFSQFQSEDKNMMKKLIISLILSTDMSNHNALNDELDEVYSNFPFELVEINEKKYHLPPSSSSPSSVTNSSNFSPINSSSFVSENKKIIQNEKYRLSLLKSLLHLADISNTSKPWELSLIWSNYVNEEFYQQDRYEKEQNHSPLSFMNINPEKQDENSINFNDFFVSISYYKMSLIFSSFFVYCDELLTNRVNWNQIFLKRLRTMNELLLNKKNDIINKIQDYENNQDYISIVKEINENELKISLYEEKERNYLKAHEEYKQKIKSRKLD